MSELFSIFRLAAASVDSGWEVPIFPPYFIAGAIFGAGAVVLTFAAAARAICGPDGIVTEKHIDRMCKVVLVSGTIVGYAYCMELFMGWYSASKYEGDAFLLRTRYGPSAWYSYMTFFCNVIAPQTFWFRKARKNVFWALFVSICVNFGMFYERYVHAINSWPFN